MVSLPAVIYVLSSACLEDNIPREVASRRNLFTLITRKEVKKKCTELSFV